MSLTHDSVTEITTKLKAVRACLMKKKKKKIQHTRRRPQRFRVVERLDVLRRALA